MALATITPADSAQFMFWLPITFYVVWRVALPWLGLKKLAVITGAGWIAFAVTMTPVVRQRISGGSLFSANQEIDFNRFVNANRHLTRAMQWSPTHPEIPYVRYRLAEAAGDTEKTREFLAEAIEKGRDEIDLLYKLARLYAEAGITEEEITFYQRILERRPNHPEAHYCLAMYYDTRLGDGEKAIHHLEIARDHLPRDNEWRQRCERILQRLKNSP